MKLITKLRKADSSKKTEIFQNADLNREDTLQLIRDMILTLPKGHYMLQTRGRAAQNIVDAIYEIYGWYASAFVNESMMLGMQVLYPKKVYVTFTHGLDVIEIK